MRCALTLLLALAVGLPLHAKKLKVSIYSDAASGYKRSYHADGSPVVEYYALAYGGLLEGTAFGPTQKEEDFPDVAGVIGDKLAEEGYLFAENFEQADHMLVIHWGATNTLPGALGPQGNGQADQAINDMARARLAGSFGSIESAGDGTAAGAANARALNAQIQSDAQSEFVNALLLNEIYNRERDRRVARTAGMLGYTDALISANMIAGSMGSFMQYELTSELEDPRYYVVIIAYDFDDMVKHRKRTLRWVTRASIRVQGNDFMDKLDEIVAQAGNYYGRDTKRLIRRYQGEVEIGELQVVGTDAKLSDDED